MSLLASLEILNPKMADLEQFLRVIIVGAGFAGLTASRCLQKAGIEQTSLSVSE